MATGTSPGMYLHKRGCRETPTRWQQEHGSVASVPAWGQLLGGGQASLSSHGLPQPSCLPSQELGCFLFFPDVEKEGEVRCLMHLLCA